MTEKIKIMLVKRKMSAVDLAKILECSPTNIYNKLKRDNFSEKALKQIADILNCDFRGSFIMRDTGEENKNFLLPAPRYAILNIRKGKSHRSGSTHHVFLLTFCFADISRQLLAVVGGYFFFPCKSDKSN